MLTPKDINELYKKYDVSASKRFGQNFLIDNNILTKIVEAADINGKDVVEIGPGLGSLTYHLLEKAKSVTSFELDRDMIRVLKNEISDNKFVLVEGDFLKQELNWDEKRTLVANIPYNITTDIIFRIFKDAKKFDKAILMVQKEYGMRMMSKPNSKDYGKLAITTSIFSDISLVTKVPPKSFIPSPKVDSVVIRLDIKNADMEKELKFIEFVKFCFSQRRKTLINNLKTTYEKENILKAIQSLGLNENVRPQEIAVESFKNLFKQLSNI